MTRDEALAAAQQEATASHVAVDVWEHVGGRSPQGVLLPQGRFVTKEATASAPKWAWRKVATVQP